MSEKELRKAIEEYMQAGSPSASQVAWDNIEEVLSDEPDVVVLAKKEQHFLELAGGDPEDEVNPHDPLTEKGVIWWRGYRQCCADSLKDMLKQFHIRLTETGWEWTEETAW